MSGIEEMLEAKRLKVSIVDDADVDLVIELIMDGGICEMYLVIVSHSKACLCAIP